MITRIVTLEQERRTRGELMVPSDVEHRLREELRAQVERKSRDLEEANFLIMDLKRQIRDHDPQR